MDLKEFIQNRKHLVWYVPDPKELNKEAVVEATLNYGDWDDVQILFRILGVAEVARIFREHISDTRSRQRYDDKIQNYFKLYFDKYAPGNTDRRTRSTPSSA